MNNLDGDHELVSAGLASSPGIGGGESLPFPARTKISPPSSVQARSDAHVALDIAAALTSGWQGTSRSGGLAEGLLTFITPTIRFPDVLAAGRIEPLLHLALSLIPADGSELSELAAQALQQEIINQQQLAELAANQADINGP